MRDLGYFPRGTSVLRQVHEERVVGLMYGQRALCIGALMPPNYVGTAEHTAAKLTPFRRLAHTGKWFETIMLGSRADADRVLAAVHKMHSRVHGTMPETEGPYPAGTPYDAFDPDAMLWTVAVAMDSAECFYDLLVRRLQGEERERLWQDYVRFGELFGMPREVAPPTYPDFRAYFDGLIASDRMWLTDEARMVGYATAFEIPMPLHAQPAKRVHDLLMLGSLPARVRRLYRLAWTPAHAVAFRGAVQATRAARRATPPQLRRGYNAVVFDSVAATEAARIKRGRATPQLVTT